MGVCGEGHWCGVGASDYLSENVFQWLAKRDARRLWKGRVREKHVQRGKDKRWRHRVSDTERRAEPRVPLCLTLPQASSTAAFTLLVKQIRAATDSTAQHVS